MGSEMRCLPQESLGRTWVPGDRWDLVGEADLAVVEVGSEGRAMVVWADKGAAAEDSEGAVWVDLAAAACSCRRWSRTTRA